MITESMYIGSGDIHALLSGFDTVAYTNLIKRFVSGEKPYYNALASPIDALRTGAIIESVFTKTLPFNYFGQYVVKSEDMDVFKASLDFAEIEGGKVKSFIELKTISFDDFFDQLANIRDDQAELLKWVKKHKKIYYNQVQEQLYCTGLDSATLCFVCVFTYDDEENWEREIKENEIIRVTIPRDEAVIEQIKQRGFIFQEIKDFHLKTK